MIFLQEHWLFECKLQKINDLSDNINFAAKGADHFHPLQPCQLPRGYGGTAIIWKKELDTYVKVLQEGNERIQCVELKTNSDRPILCISVYLPSKGKADSTEEFLDCIEILSEICTTFQSSHDIVIAGDLNEHLSKPHDSSTKRALALNNFIAEFDFQYSNDGKTYISPAGHDCTEIDYFLVRVKDTKFTQKKVLRNIATNTSDHHPIEMSLQVTVIPTKKKSNKPKSKAPTKLPVKWDRVDLQEYEDSVSQHLQSSSVNVGKDTVEVTCTKLIEVLSNASAKFQTTKRPRRSNPKIKVWNAEISLNLRNMRHAVRQWALAGKPTDPTHAACLQRKLCKRSFRSSIRREHARRDTNDKLKIMNAKSNDAKLFHKLINKQRKRALTIVEDLHVAEETFVESEIVDGFKKHFEALGQETVNDQFDDFYHSQVEVEVSCIEHLASETPAEQVTPEELDKAIRNINRGKSADINGLTIEHVLHAGPRYRNSLLAVINSIFHSGVIPEVLKVGLLSPIFKNKGSANDAANYRGITVLPVFEKIIEYILKERTYKLLERSQSTFQRGFTKHTSPLHASLIVEEVARESKDTSTDCNFIMLDAKAAFDVVCHNHLLRRLYHSGVTDIHWNLIQSLHTNSTSVVKWQGKRSDPFQVFQGVKQGGIASTDFYKSYVNPLLLRLENTNLGAHIGNINCCSSACADDVTINAADDNDTQVLISIAEDFAKAERYLLQPKKTEAVHFTSKRDVAYKENFQLYDCPINSVESSTHLGVKRSTSLSKTAETHIDSNIQKARKALYSLMSSGLHGNNGLDPATSLHLLNIYVMPILTYGLDVIYINKTQTAVLERFQKKILKQILSLPTTTSDSAVYILSGFLPIEATIHKKILTLFNNVCLQPESSVEKRLARRQLAVKTHSSVSWFITAKKLLLRYDLPDPDDLLSGSYNKHSWKRVLNAQINRQWQSSILDSAALSSSLRHMHHTYRPGKLHPLLQIPLTSARDLTRIPVKLRLLTSTYILQSTRVAFNQNEVDPTCRLCFECSETMEHFLLNCPVLELIRNSCLPEIRQNLEENFNMNFDRLSASHKIRVLLDCTFLFGEYTCNNISESSLLDKLHSLETLCRRYLYNIHASRYSTISSTSRSRSNKNKNKRARAHHPLKQSQV